MVSPSDDRSAGRSARGFTPASLNMVRFALLAGVVLFGGIAWYLTRSGQVAPALDAETAMIFRFAFYGLVLVAAVGIVLVRPRARAAETFQQRAQLSIIGYALAESTALFGAVYLMMTGMGMLYLVGLFVFLIAMFLFPAGAA